MEIYLGLDNSYSTESRCIFLFMLHFSDIVIKLSWVQVIEYKNILGTSDRAQHILGTSDRAHNILGTSDRAQNMLGTSDRAHNMLGTSDRSQNLFRYK